MVLLHQRDQIFTEFRGVKFQPGNVDGNRRFFQDLYDLFPDIGVQLHDKAVPLKKRDEIPWRNDPLFRMEPADQRFSAYDLSRIQADHRLDIDVELACL